MSWHGALIRLSAFCFIKVLSSVQNVFAVFFSRRSEGFIKKIIVRKIEIFQKKLGYLGIFRNFRGYLEIFGGIFRKKIENFRIDF